MLSLVTCIYLAWARPIPGLSWCHSGKYLTQSLHPYTFFICNCTLALSYIIPLSSAIKIAAIKSFGLPKESVSVALSLFNILEARYFYHAARLPNPFFWTSRLPNTSFTFAAASISASLPTESIWRPAVLQSATNTTTTTNPALWNLIWTVPTAITIPTYNLISPTHRIWLRSFLSLVMTHYL